METLDEYNARIRKKREPKPYPAYVSCPKCGTEMQFPGGRFYAEEPFEWDVECSECGHKGKKLSRRTVPKA